MAPDDPLPRLVFADWLEEHGQPEEAAVLRGDYSELDILALWRWQRMSTEPGGGCVARRDTPTDRTGRMLLFAAASDALGPPLPRPILEVHCPRGGELLECVAFKLRMDGCTMPLTIRVGGRPVHEGVVRAAEPGWSFTENIPIPPGSTVEAVTRGPGRLAVVFQLAVGH